MAPHAKLPAAKLPAAKPPTLKERAAQAAKVAGPEGKDTTHKFQKGWKAPKSVAIAADALWNAQLKKSEAQKAVDLIAAEESDLKAWIIETLPKSEASGVAGKLCRVTITKKDVPRVEDWPKVYESIVAQYQAHKLKKDGMEASAFALLQKRLGEAAVKEIWENGKTLEGVGKFTVTSLSVNKV